MGKSKAVTEVPVERPQQKQEIVKPREKMFYLHGAIVTPLAPACNNRGGGDSENGNVVPLQKLTIENETYVMNSSDATRFASRARMDELGALVNRRFNPDELNRDLQIYLRDQTHDVEKYIDDLIWGFMAITKATTGSDGKRVNGESVSRRSLMELNHSVSIDPYNDDKSYHATAGKKDNASLHENEIILTNFSYPFTCCLNDFLLSPKGPEGLLYILQCLRTLHHVGGNHARCLFDYRPESVIFRITHDASHGFMYCFNRGTSSGSELGPIGLKPWFVRNLSVGDLRPQEMFVGGQIATNNNYNDCPLACRNESIKATFVNLVKALSMLPILKGKITVEEYESILPDLDFTDLDSK